MRPGAALLFLVLLSTSLHAQTVWYVDDDCVGPGSGTLADPFCTVQAGIDAAAAGDTVLVRPGLYLETVDFGGRAVTVRSDVDGNPLTVDLAIATAIIDAQFAGTAVTLSAGAEPDDGAFQGFTVTGGNPSGILCAGNDFGFTPLVADNLVTASTDSGIRAEHCAPFLTRNFLQNNLVGLDVVGAGGTASRNVITGNSTSGVEHRQSCMTTSHNRVFGNALDGVCIFESDPFLLNEAIHDNGGFAINVLDADLIIDHCTMYGNDAGGINNFEGRTTISNSILWNDTMPEIFLDRDQFGSGVTIHYSDLRGGPASIVQGPGCGCFVSIGSAMIETDPLLEDPVNGDLNPTKASPCINRGDGNTTQVTDLDGDARVVGGTPDLGAEEYGGPFQLDADGYLLDTAVGGGVIHFSLDAGVASAGRVYGVLASVSGNAPGTPLPGSSAVVAINWDLFTNLVINLSLAGPAFFPGFVSTLDGQGKGTATFDTLGRLGPGASGLTMSFSFTLLGPLDFGSNPVNVTVL